MMRLLLPILLLLSGCALAPSPQQRLQQADTLATAYGWQGYELPADPFTLTAFGPPPQTIPDLTVYIEGDGSAWADTETPSPDPTPRNPVALKLALAAPEHAAYLARPCQYNAQQPACADSGWWTDRRYAQTVVTSMGTALDQLKARYGVQKLTLVGYSGGGAIAALLAATRPDVVRLVTVAGNLATTEWVKAHRLSPLSGSLDPADVAPPLAALPQVHYMGADDSNVTPALAAAFAARFPAGRKPAIRVIEGYDHTCCWVEHWPELARSAGLLP